MCKQRFSLDVKVNILTFKFVPHSFIYGQLWILEFYPDHFPVPYIRLSQLRFKKQNDVPPIFTGLHR